MISRVAVVCGKRVGTNNLSAAFVGIYSRENVFHRRESVTSACSEMLERNIVRQILVERVNADRECRVEGGYTVFITSGACPCFQ